MSGRPNVLRQLPGGFVALNFATSGPTTRVRTWICTSISPVSCTRCYAAPVHRPKSTEPEYSATYCKS